MKGITFCWVARRNDLGVCGCETRENWRADTSGMVTDESLASARVLNLCSHAQLTWYRRRARMAKVLGRVERKELDIAIAFIPFGVRSETKKSFGASRQAVR